MHNFSELFDQVVPREGTRSDKWDARSEVFSRADVMPLWVADMDFRAPKEVIAHLKARAEHGVFGYPLDDGLDQASVVEWVKRRHGLSLSEDDILFSPGVVPSMFYALSALNEKGSLIAVQPPVYGPFYTSIERAGMQPYFNPLKDGKMDLDGLEDGLKKGVKALLLCNPHNPVGRVYTAEEMSELAQLLDRYGAHLISDEIHADLIMPGHKHIPSLKVYPRAVMLISATKTFNLAGLRHSSILVSDKDLRDRIKKSMAEHAASETNIFGMLAQTVAYEKGEAWLDALLKYFGETRDMVKAFFAENLKDFPLTDLQGTYLQWIDARKLNLTNDALVKFFVDKAGLGFTGGKFFGDVGDGFVRMNLATPRENIARALTQMKEAIDKR